MMDWTDRHCRYLHRLIAPRTLLYTEMVTANAVLFGDRERLLGFNTEEHPVALQLGGSDPRALADAARIGHAFGYDEINLNCGCPSDRVQSGRFGACLMAEPELVADCMAAMMDAVDCPVTVKCRIGIDDMDEWRALSGFVGPLADRGVDTFIVHARKAWLKGLSPRENRDVPPLRYELVERLKAERPELEVILNGGLTEVNQAKAALATLDGVMIGRAAYQSPMILAEMENALLPLDPDKRPVIDGQRVIRNYAEYARRQIDRGVPLNAMARHLHGMFQGIPGARAWRRHLSEQAPRRPDDAGVILEALDFVSFDRTQPVERLSA